MNDERISFLQEPELFRELTPEQIRELINISRRVTFQSGETVMREGDEGDSLYIILDGTVEVVKSLVLPGMDEDDTTDRSKVFTRLSARDHAVFGEIALLEKQKRTATITALTDCVLYEISKDDFLRLAEEDTDLGYRVALNLARIVSSRLRKADEDTIKLTTALSIILKQT
ncbi:MAG TPA: cyclic nucleotide-binding domain-containing protein [Syntrophales bacterium]|nr:cyclic nucleotide-binding domain-containing protein [Syntrophales bacterium]